MTLELLPASAYENLPLQDERRFAELMATARRNMRAMMAEVPAGKMTSEHYGALQAELMTIGDELAALYRVGGLPSPDATYVNPDARFRDFDARLTGIIARIRAQAVNVVADPMSVRLAHRSKAWLRQEIEQLRSSIEQADISESKRTALLRKLNELYDELNKERLGLAQTLLLLAALATISGEGSTTLVDAPQTTKIIQSFVARIGQDKAKEDEEQLRLCGPMSSDVENTSQTDHSTPPPTLPQQGTLLAAPSPKLSPADGSEGDE